MTTPPTINNGNVAFMIVTTVLVFLMTPGLALFYSGLTTRKSSLTMMYYSFVAIGIVTVIWALGGYSLVFGDSIGGIIGSPSQYYLLQGDLASTIDTSQQAYIPQLIFFMYQLMFAIITAPLMTGALAERMAIGGWMVVLAVWTILVYCPVAHWVWGGGFLQEFGFIDYAGGTVIHATAGFAALIGVWYLGSRSRHNTTPSNIRLVLVGTTLLMAGWFGFNAGGALVSSYTAVTAFANTALASGFSTLIWIAICYARERRFSIEQLANGAIAGLATITPCAGYVSPQAAIAIGVLAPIVCYGCLQWSRRRGWDDTLGVWGIHGMGGVAGSLFVGFFASAAVGGVTGGWRQFTIQLLGVLGVVVYTMLASWLIFWVVDKLGILRVAPEVQSEGLDPTYLSDEE